ncbi:MAG: hypothetical protein C4348_00525 [Patescibacteria group bacterium]
MTNIRTKIKLTKLIKLTLLILILILSFEKSIASNHCEPFENDNICRPKLHNCLIVNKPDIKHPTSTATELRDYIVGYGFIIEYGVNKLQGNFRGKYFLKINGNEQGREDITTSEGEQKSAMFCVPETAGKVRIESCYDAGYDNNLCRGGCITKSIQVYRYLCYQGFCYECWNEPIENGRIKVAGNCASVEPQKCSFYIKSDCRAGVRE